MLTPQRTHREVKNPRMSARHLADYMSASETAKRTIVRDCKYQSTARVLQHDEAKLSIGKYFRSGADATSLRDDARRLRDRIADSDFDRDLFDHNADYIERYADVRAGFALPNAQRHAAPSDAVRRFQNMKSACASIAERWPNVQPPAKAVL